MSVRDDLILVGWLSSLAPQASGLAGAGPRATAAVRRLFREPDRLDAALSNALRRASATAVLQMPERMDPVDAQRAILADRAGFAALLPRSEPAIVALSTCLNALAPIRGQGARLATVALEAFRVQATDLFPREDMGGRGLALDVLEGLGEGLSPAELAVLERERTALRGRGSPPERRAPSEVPDDPEERLMRVRAELADARAADDVQGELLLLEAVAEALAALGKRGAAVAVLGETARRSRAAVEAASEARALSLAGRLLCEAPAGEDDPGHGLAMLLHAVDIAASVDPILSDLVRRYVTGFQYTLSDARFAALEPLLEGDRDVTITRCFQEYRARYAEALP